MSAQSHRQDQGQIRGIHVFWTIFGFFAVTIAVNAFFIVRAVGTFPGEQVEKSYLVGLEYNDELARKEEQRRLGWVAQAGFADEPVRSLVVRLQTPDGLPVSGLDMSAEIFLSGAGDDVTRLDLSERAAGEYVADGSALGVGRAVVEIEAFRPGEAKAVFVASKKLESK